MNWRLVMSVGSQLFVFWILCLQILGLLLLQKLDFSVTGYTQAQLVLSLALAVLALVPNITLIRQRNYTDLTLLNTLIGGFLLSLFLCGIVAQVLPHIVHLN